MPKKKPMTGRPEVNKELEGFDIKINEFGEIITNYQVERLNEFLNDHVEDKKLVGRNEEKEKKPDKEQD